MFARLWNDDSGAVVSTEYVMVTGLAVGAAGSGVVAIRNAAIKQANHLAETIATNPAPSPEELRRMVVMPNATPSQTGTELRCQCNQSVTIILPPSP